MKVRKYQQTEEKTILTAMIVHDEVLTRIFHQLGPKARPFRNRWSNLICNWCLAYFEKYHRAPKGVVQTLFERYANNEPEEEVVDLVERFLAALSEKHSRTAREINAQFVVDLASRYFQIINYEKKQSALESALENNDLEEVNKIEAKYKPIKFSSTDWSTPFNSSEIDETITYYDEDRRLVQFPGDLGRFLSPAFEREGFISFAGAEKKGKSYWLSEVVWRGLTQRRRIIYYVLGDMSKRQANFRLYKRATLRPQKTITIQWPKKIAWKRSKEEGKYPSFEVDSEERRLEPMTKASILKARKRLSQRTASGENRLRIITAGASIISATDVENDIRNFSAEGFVPDLVVIDYADLLAPEIHSLRQEYRHQVNESWKVLRRISLDYHLLMVTATQAAARAYDSWVMRKKDFSEDKRKNAHVTGTIGINQTSDEKKAGVYRLNWVFLRDGKWADDQVVWTVGNLELACPCLKSCL